MRVRKWRITDSNGLLFTVVAEHLEVSATGDLLAFESSGVDRHCTYGCRSQNWQVFYEVNPKTDAPMCLDNV